MKAPILTLAILLGLTLCSNAQSTDNINDFNYLVGKIKADYPGYTDKVTSKTAPELAKMEQDIRRKIKLYPDSCDYYFYQYCDWFKDHHLRVNRIRSKKSSAPGIEKDERQFMPISADTMAILQSERNSIQGIWHTFRGDIAIVKVADNKFIGVAIQYRDFEKNQIVFTMNPTSKGEFDMAYFSEYYNYQAIEGKASLRLNDQILELHDDTRFVRKTESTICNEALLESYRAEFPNGRNTYPVALSLSDSTFYIRIPSFDNNNGTDAIKKHWTEITTRPNLIIDIRNNGGGQDQYYQILADLIYTKPYMSKGVEWYATKNNIKLFEDGLKEGTIRNGEEGIKWVNSLLSVMKKNIGGFVVHPMMGSDVKIQNDTIYPFPKKVGIIINEGNASSAEQFILMAKNSSKTTLFGNSNTAGVLDYSNAVTENFPSNRYRLTFPMTRSRRLPSNPIDNIGITPDIMIPYPATEQLYDRIDQWVYFVLKYLEYQNPK